MKSLSQQEISLSLNTLTEIRFGHCALDLDISKWKGENLLGYALMMVRQQL